MLTIHGQGHLRCAHRSALVPGAAFALNLLLLILPACRPSKHGTSASGSAGDAHSSSGSAMGGVSSGGQASTGSLGGKGGTSSGGGSSRESSSATGGIAGGGTGGGGGSVNAGSTVVGGSSALPGTTGGTGSGGGATGTGGTGGSGGGTGTGGQSGMPLPHGFKPTTISLADADTAYADWKSDYLEDCGGGVFRTRWENDKKDATVSEGIGYGMLLTVAHDDRAAFDGLWSYYKKGSQSNGLLNWLRYGCDAHRDTKYSQYPDGAATDADLDAAMALVMAKCRWGSTGNGTDYGAAATSLIGSIKSNETGTDNGKAYLQPGDSTWFEGMGGGCINPSYFAPAYYRAFAKFLSTQADKDFWNKLADDTYPILSAGANSTTGLVRNWTSTSGATAACASSYSNPDDFGSDAARTPWRIATDYVWWGTQPAKSFLDKMTTWAKGKGVASIGQWYKVDGSVSSHADADTHTVITLGAFACGAVAFDQTTADEFATEVKNLPTASGFDANYFSRSLRAVYLLLLTGQFTTCGSKT